MITETVNKDPLLDAVEKAKTWKGDALAKLIMDITGQPGVYKFRELLDIPNVKEFEHNATPVFNLLRLFAYHTYSDYEANKVQLPQLNEQQINKLRLLTVVTLASRAKHVNYADLQKELGLSELRDIEDLIIEAICSEIISGKLNQREKRLEVKFVIGRDLVPTDIEYIMRTLSSWCDSCQGTVATLEMLITDANTKKSKHVEEEAKRKKAAEALVESPPQQTYQDSTSGKQKAVKNNRIP